MRHGTAAAVFILTVCPASAQVTVAEGTPEAELVAMMEANGCVATEDAIMKILMQEPYGLSGAEAALKNWAQLGVLKWDQQSSYTLTGVGKCK